MSQDHRRPDALLLEALRLTRAEELDCDAFHALLAPLLDDRIDCQRVKAAMDHHRLICPECDEELTILRRALGLAVPLGAPDCEPDDDLGAALLADLGLASGREDSGE
jgi:hypothetical protein